MTTAKKEKPQLSRDERLWTVDEAIDYLQIPRSTFYMLMAKGDIKKIKIGKSTRFMPELLKAWAKKQAS